MTDEDDLTSARHERIREGAQRVLIVDDEPDIIEGVRLRLRRRFDIDVAHSAAEALQILEREGHFAVVLTDLRMPGMNGIELLARVRAVHPHVVRTMWTGNADLPDAVDAINSGGVFRLVLKPCAPNALEKCLESAIEEYERQAAERALALMDPLLQIASRRAFEQALIRVHAHATRHDRPYGLVMVDVDYFKRFNDTYGHIAGDRALISVADAIRRSCRTSDEVFRYGGEEMVLLLPDAEPRGLQVAGERFRARVQELRIPHTGSEHQCVTISLGAAIFEAQSSDAAEAVLHRADQSLYQAKAAGRNRLMLWDSRRGLD